MGQGSGNERRAHVLVIDDEPALARTLKRALSTEYDVTSVTSAGEALTHLLAGETFDVIVCDLVMAEMTGAELHAELTVRLPEQARRMLFLTGDVSTEEARTLRDRERLPVLQKPLESASLRAAIREIASN